MAQLKFNEETSKVIEAAYSSRDVLRRRALVREAVARYAEDVRAGRFPSAEESFDDPTRANLRRIYG